MIRTDAEQRIEDLRAKRRALIDERDEVLDRASDQTGSAAGHMERVGNVDRALERVDAELAIASEEERDRIRAAVVGGSMRLESGSDGGAVFSAARSSSGHPLAFTGHSLDRLQEALDARASLRVEHDSETRAALTTTTHGSRREWGANVLSGPRLLHQVAGVPQQHVDAAFAASSVLTLPTASAGVAETVTLGEFAASTAAAVTLSRFGRFTDLSQEAMLGTSADALIAAHQIGCALDLDKVLIDATETAAGSAVAFSSDVPAAVRKALAVVQAATAAPNASDLVVLAHPDNVALLESVTPVGGMTIGEGFALFSGALVYASGAVNTGFITVANLRAGARYFEARSFQTETEVAVKTSVLTVASSVIAGYAITLVGAAVMVDVVTP